MKFELPKLEYAYDALEPWIDKETMIIHHDKHHKAYTDKLNAALEKHPEINVKSAEELLMNPDMIPEDIKTAVMHNGGGYVNHSFFWKILKKDVPLEGKIKEAIEKKYGNAENFSVEFANAAMGVFGSGWCWLVLNEDGELEIMTTANQDSPLSEGMIVPLLVIDVWEHAYYLKYQNRRADYTAAFMHVINWKQVEKNLEEGMKQGNREEKKEEEEE